jgi:acyl-CoA reductase-like NAD-dependent aldehyde dehydrogenase
MSATTRQNVLLETLAARQRAEELLKTLQQAQLECEGQLKAEQRQDAMKQVTGKSSLETAIASTRRMIEMLDRALEEARASLADDDRPEPARPENGRPEAPRVEVVARIGHAGIISPARSVGR